MRETANLLMLQLVVKSNSWRQQMTTNVDLQAEKLIGLLVQVLPKNGNCLNPVGTEMNGKQHSSGCMHAWILS